MITLIPSASYATLELTAEYGQLPPTFLPIGHSRLYELQVNLIHQHTNSEIYITLPINFIPNKYDLDWLDEMNVKIIKIDDSISLGESIFRAMSDINIDDDCIDILHGDTLYSHLSSINSDFFATSEQPSSYKWGKPKDSADNESTFVYTGFFRILSANFFISQLLKTDFKFIEAINSYKNIKSVTCETLEPWFDFGHLQNYYKAKCNVSIQRSFNSLEMDYFTVSKSSENSVKIQSEIYWYENIPLNLKDNVATYLGNKRLLNLEYQIEYLPIPSLHELFIFGEISKDSWISILRASFYFLTKCLSHKRIDNHLNGKTYLLKELVITKTQERLGDIFFSNVVDSNIHYMYEGVLLPNLTEIINISSKYINFNTPNFECVSHGDFCFTNIFYDFRSGKIKVIDPRGSINGESPSIYGDIRYDIAKFIQSFYCGYDQILAGRYQLFKQDSNIFIKLNLPKIEVGSADFYNMLKEFISEIDKYEILAIVINLFISMIPLHSSHPERQLAFFALALKIYKENFYDNNSHGR